MLRIMLAVALLWISSANAQSTAPTGELKGEAWVHTAESLRASVQGADVHLPALATGGAPFSGKLKDAPSAGGRRVPVVLFLHGSSGLGLKAIGEWQRWLATRGIASVAPDSFALPGRVTYKSPVDKSWYERILALRASEVSATLEVLKTSPWVDTERLILAGTSEGAVPVARYPGNEFAARMIFAWSCESNYFVTAPQNAFEADKPVLNIISSTDPFFSRANPWLGNPDARGHCGEALKGHPDASVILVPDAPHTLLNLPAARNATAGFLARFTGP